MQPFSSSAPAGLGTAICCRIFLYGSRDVYAIANHDKLVAAAMIAMKNTLTASRRLPPAVQLSSNKSNNKMECRNSLPRLFLKSGLSRADTGSSLYGGDDPADAPGTTGMGRWICASRASTVARSPATLNRKPIMLKTKPAIPMTADATDATLSARSRTSSTKSAYRHRLALGKGARPRMTDCTQFGMSVHWCRAPHVSAGSANTVAISSGHLDLGAGRDRLCLRDLSCSSAPSSGVDDRLKGA
jgi:hypothetical protein